jgi:hypothetical protein
VAERTQKSKSTAKREAIMGPIRVWFCTACADQAPWKHSDRVACPGCGETGTVIPAMRFGNLESPGGCGGGGCSQCQCGR